MSTPKVSVIMPVYNAGIYLEESIISILEQSFEDFEFIIIDDGSTDKSFSIIQSYALKDKRINAITRANKGLIETLNEAIDIAKGEYLARMDADDISCSERFYKQVKFLDHNKDYFAVGVLSSLIDSEGDLIGPFGNWISHSEIDNAHLEGLGGAIIHPSSMIRTSAMRAVGCYRANFKSAEDIDLWLRIAEIGKLANINERLFLYRQHLASIGYSQRSQQIENTYNAIKEACTRRGIRMSLSSQSIADISSDKNSDSYIKWGWWALNNGNIKTSKKYARKAIFSSPTSIKAWKLFLCTFRGY